jgi:hypothetical protein
MENSPPNHAREYVPNESSKISVYEMEIHSPDGIQRYHWKDRQKLPVELSEYVDSSGLSETSADPISDPLELDSDEGRLTDDVLDVGSD